MNFLERVASASKKIPDLKGRDMWNEIFGSTHKERAKPAVIPGGSWGRGIANSDASFKRLLQAMRSMAPGGWSDDRWEQSRHFVGIAYMAIHRSGEQLAQSEFQLFKKDRKHPKGKREVTPDDPPEGGRMCRPYDLIDLLEKPNNDDSFGDLMYMWNLQLDLTGMALTWMVPNKLGDPFELYSIPTAIAIPQPCINPDYPDGYYRIQPIYPYGPFSSYPTPTTAVGAAVPAQWMLRFKYPHPLLRYDGYSPLSALRLYLDELESIDRSRWYKMKRSINPSAVLDLTEMEGSQPLPEQEIDRIHVEWENENQGPENHGRLIVGTPGGELKEWGSRAIDMDYPEGWSQLTSISLAGFGITKPVAGMVEDNSYSTLFASLKQVTLLTNQPKCNRMARGLTRHIAPFFGDDLILEIRCPRIDDHDVKNTKIQTLISAKAITKNEVRDELEMPLTEEEWGEEIAGEGGQEQQQQGMPGMPGQGGPEEAGEEPGANPQPQKPAEDIERDEAFEVATTRPRPGKLGIGALGPRKQLLNGTNGKHRRK